MVSSEEVWSNRYQLTRGDYLWFGRSEVRSARSEAISGRLL